MFWGPPKKGLLGDVPPEGALAHFEKWGQKVAGTRVEMCKGPPKGAPCALPQRGNVK